MKKLLIVVDYQNDFVSGTLGFEGAGDIAVGIKQRIIETQESGGDVVFTLDTHYENYLKTQEGKKLPVVHCIKNTWGWNVEDTVKEYALHTFEKPTFGSIDLGIWLRDHNYDVIELCGLVSNICVVSNAIIAKAALPEAEIIVDASLTASYDTLRHEQVFSILEGLQITVFNA